MCKYQLSCPYTSATGYDSMKIKGMLISADSSRVVSNCAWLKESSSYVVG
jgi:hypothetical protein